MFRSAPSLGEECAPKPLDFGIPQIAGVILDWAWARELVKHRKDGDASDQDGRGSCWATRAFLALSVWAFH